MKRLLTLLTVALAMTACEPDKPFDPLFDEVHAGSPALNVVSYNVYVGAELEQLLTVGDLQEIPGAALLVWWQVMATNFAERAEAIANQIEAANAHVVGLQEMSLFRLQSPSDFPFPPPLPLPAPNAVDSVLDYLALLTDALEAHGLYYDVASKSTNMDIELPIAVLDDQGNLIGMDDLRLTDYDVVLVRRDVPWTAPANGNFAAAMPVFIGESVVPIFLKPSGWASVDITFKGNSYRFVNAHLEPADVLPDGGVHPDLAYIQAKQLEELLGIVDTSPHPVILVGDFNSDDDGSTTATYQTVRDAGFVDAWLIGRPRGTGYTANQSPDLRNETSELFHRIDFIFYRDEFTAAKGKLRGSVAVEVLGEEQSDRTASGLWPSDHAAVSATLRIAPGSH